MTSANAIEYTIFDKDNKEVGHHRQNIMCSTCNDGLEKFKPSKDFTILAWGYDEEEEYWENDNTENLELWLSKHPAQYTSKNFQIDDKVKVSKKRGEGIVVEVIKGNFFNNYNIKLSNGDILNDIKQNEVLPI